MSWGRMLSNLGAEFIKALFPSSKFTLSSIKKSSRDSSIISLICIVLLLTDCMFNKPP